MQSFFSSEMKNKCNVNLKVFAIDILSFVDLIFISDTDWVCLDGLNSVSKCKEMVKRSCTIDS